MYKIFYAGFWYVSFFPPKIYMYLISRCFCPKCHTGEENPGIRVQCHRHLWNSCGSGVCSRPQILCCWPGFRIECANTLLAAMWNKVAIMCKYSIKTICSFKMTAALSAQMDINQVSWHALVSWTELFRTGILFQDVGLRCFLKQHVKWMQWVVARGFRVLCLWVEGCWFKPQAQQLGA